MGFKVTIEELTSVEDANRVLVHMKERCPTIHFNRPQGDTPFIGFNGYVWTSKNTLNIRYKVAGKLRKYIFRLDGAKDMHLSDGGTALSLMTRMADDPSKIQRYYAVDKPKRKVIEEGGETPANSAGFLYSNDRRFGGKETIAWEYDINSAYAWAACQPIPDLKTMRKDCLLEEGEIGFVEEYNIRKGANPVLTQIMVEGEGKFVQYAFKTVESPYKHWAEFYYNKKAKAERGSTERAKVKALLVMGIGELANVNPFVRNCIVERCNRRIQRLIDANTIYCNTDSIISAVPRPDIERQLGDLLGDFKLEKAGVGFRLKKGTLICQWVGEKPKYRGVPKSWFTHIEERTGKEYNILTDEVPTDENIYYLDHDEIVIKRKEY